MRHKFGLGLVLSLSLVVGCAPPEQIQSYRAKKETVQKLPDEPETPGVGQAEGPDAYRILGAVLPADIPDEEFAWYFKGVGTTADLAQQEENFNRFFASLEFKNGPKSLPSWTLPEGWKTAPRRDFTEAVLKYPGGELTVSRAKGGLKANLERWAVQQLQMPPEKVKDFQPYLTPLKIGELSGYRINLTGPGNPAARRGPMMKGQ